MVWKTNKEARQTNIQLEWNMLYDQPMAVNEIEQLFQQKSGSYQIIPGQPINWQTLCYNIDDNTQHNKHFTHINSFKKAVRIKHR